MSEPTSNGKSAIDSFSVRCLNPLTGTRLVVQSGDVRAICNDGLHWHIQALSCQSDVSVFNKVGDWDQRLGFRYVKNHASGESRLAKELETFVALLPEYVDKKHFPLKDNFEYWGLDGEGNPIALIASTYQKRLISTVSHTYWQASPASDIGFPSAALNDDPADHHPRFYAEVLEKKISKRISIRRWIQRQNDGSGTLVATPFTALTEKRHWQESCFPEFGVTDSWEDSEGKRLYQDWINWTAPMLLTLSSLNDETRRQLEMMAIKRSIHVTQLFRLYPKILQPQLIERARIESRIRLAV